MLISQQALAALCLYACLLGAALGLLYDLLRITGIFCGASYGSRRSQFTEKELPLIGKRKARKPKKRLLEIVVFLQDFFFCIFAALSFILLFYQANNGKIRVLAILTAILGFVLYRATLGKPILFASETIAFIIDSVWRYFLFFLFFPFAWFGKRLLKWIKKTVGRVLQEHDRRTRRKYTEKQREYAPHQFAGKKPPVDVKKQRKDGRHAERKKEKPEFADANSFGGHGGGFHRGIHQ